MVYSRDRPTIYIVTGALIFCLPLSPIGGGKTEPECFSYKQAN